MSDGGAMDAPRGHHLEDIACGDILSRATHRLLKGRTGKGGLQRWERRGRGDGRLRRWHRSRQAGQDLVHGPLCLNPRGDSGTQGTLMHQYDQAMHQVIVGDNAVAQVEGRKGQAEGIRRWRGQPLKAAHQVIAQRTYGSPRKAGQVGGQGGSILGQQPAQHL